MYSEIAWAAGLFDGEGHTRWNRHTNLRWHSGQLKMDMAQTKSPELLYRFLKAVGRGSVVGPYGPYQNIKHSPAWYWRCSGDDVLDVFHLLGPYLGTAKRQQLAIAINKWAQFYEQKQLEDRGDVYEPAR